MISPFKNHLILVKDLRPPVKLTKGNWLERDAHILKALK